MHVFLGLDPLHHVAADVERRVEFRLLRQVADLGALCAPGLAGEILVPAGHDLEQRRFAGAVHPDHADLHAGQEVQVDVFEHLLAARVGLGDPAHVVDILIGGHYASSGNAGLGLDSGAGEAGQWGVR